MFDRNIINLQLQMSGMFLRHSVH